MDFPEKEIRDLLGRPRAGRGGKMSNWVVGGGR